jgi:hypothetical protein
LAKTLAIPAFRTLIARDLVNLTVIGGLTGVFEIFLSGPTKESLQKISLPSCSNSNISDKDSIEKIPRTIKKSTKNFELPYNLRTSSRDSGSQWPRHYKPRKDPLLEQHSCSWEHKVYL